MFHSKPCEKANVFVIFVRHRHAGKIYYVKNSSYENRIDIFHPRNSNDIGFFVTASDTTSFVTKHCYNPQKIEQSLETQNQRIKRLIELESWL